ncbi:Ribosomal protein S6 kinase delta-1 [Cichlidogyrus casuarinus]|uniref:Ribosomal protein S6 kinase delta-1 n=1 Tax=Cichlidogyrus casuarinus TaxID=1844966 RepID=A0ABD2QGU2_9PLAT
MFYSNIDRFSDSVIKNRKNQLQHFMNYCTSHCHMFLHNKFIKFFHNGVVISSSEASLYDPKQPPKPLHSCLKHKNKLVVDRNFWNHDKQNPFTGPKHGMPALVNSDSENDDDFDDDSVSILEEFSSLKNVSYSEEAMQTILKAEALEQNEDLDEAFELYKEAVSILLKGVQNEKTDEKRLDVRKLTSICLSRAEHLHRKNDVHKKHSNFVWDHCFQKLECLKIEIPLENAARCGVRHSSQISEVRKNSPCKRRARSLDLSEKTLRRLSALESAPIDHSLSSHTPDVTNGTKSVDEPLLPYPCLYSWAAELVIAVQALHSRGVILHRLDRKSVFLGPKGHLCIDYFCRWYGDTLAADRRYSQNNNDYLRGFTQTMTGIPSRLMNGLIMSQTEKSSENGPSSSRSTADLSEFDFECTQDWFRVGLLLYEMFTGLEFFEAHALIQDPNGLPHAVNTCYGVPKELLFPESINKNVSSLIAMVSNRSRVLPGIQIESPVGEVFSDVPVQVSWSRESGEVKPQVSARRRPRPGYLDWRVEKCSHLSFMYCNSLTTLVTPPHSVLIDSHDLKQEVKLKIFLNFFYKHCQSHRTRFGLVMNYKMSP